MPHSIPSPPFTSVQVPVVESSLVPLSCRPEMTLVVVWEADVRYIWLMAIPLVRSVQALPVYRYIPPSLVENRVLVPGWKARSWWSAWISGFPFWPYQWPAIVQEPPPSVDFQMFTPPT